MHKLCEWLTDLQHAPVIMILLIELIFLALVMYVFKADFPSELRTVMKDAFLAWNGASLLAINVAVKKEESSCDH